nr:hypothetical protein [Limnoglobus roseus]
MIQIVVFAIMLVDQDFFKSSVPIAAPRLIGPAEAKREVWLATLQDLVHWAMQQAAAAEPVMIIAKATNTVLSGELGLCGTGFWQPQIIEA